MAKSAGQNDSGETAPAPGDASQGLWAVGAPAASGVVLVLGAGTAISLLGDSTLYTVLPRPEIAGEAGVTLTMVGVLLGANRAVRLLTNGIAGALYDRYPRRLLLAASLLLGALSTLLFAAGRGPVPLLASRLLWGVAWSGIWVGGNACVLDVSSAANRGRLSGRYQMWFFFGSGAAALFGAVLTDLLGFRQGLLIGGILTALAALAWWRALPDLKPQVATKTRGRQVAGPFPWGTAVSAAVPMFVTRFVFAGVLTATAATWLTHLVGDGLPLGGLFVPIASFTGVFAASRALVSVGGAGLAGYVSDLVGQRWLVIAAALAAGAAGALLATSAGLARALAGGLLAAVAAGGVQALVPALAGDHSGSAQRGRVLSIAYTLGDLGSAIAPPLAFWLLQWWPVTALYQGCAALLALTVLFAAVRWLGERRSQSR